MLIELIFKPFIILINFIIGLIPNFSQSSLEASTSFFDLVRLGLYFFGTAPFVLVLASVVTWSAIHLGWAITEWLYKKIPGVD